MSLTYDIIRIEIKILIFQGIDMLKNRLMVQMILASIIGISVGTFIVFPVQDLQIFLLQKNSLKVIPSPSQSFLIVTTPGFLLFSLSML